MEKKSKILLLTFSLLFALGSLAGLCGFKNNFFFTSDLQIFYDKIKTLKEKDLSSTNLSTVNSLQTNSYLAFNELIVSVGKSFLGTPYEFYTLDKNYPEELVINLKELDCLTYLENVLAISRILKKGENDFQDFKKEIQLIRYREGGPVDYANRLHYYTDWLNDAEKKGLLKNIPGPDEFKKPIFLLSQNTSRKNEIEKIKKTEEALSEQTTKFFSCNTLAKLDLDQLLQDGDIIGFTSNIDGLDVNHVAFALKENTRWTFLNATSVNKKEVEVYKGDLVEYCSRVKANTGIVLARPLEP